MKKTASQPSKRSPSSHETLPAQSPPKVFVISLGCPKNLIDTQYALGALGSQLGGPAFCQTRDDADIILVNTCSFLEEAVSESIQTILEAAEGKKPGQVLAVMGCLPMRYGRQMEDLLPEVDMFCFSQDPVEAGRLFAKFFKHKSGMMTTPVVDEVFRITTGSPWQQYVKISEGCSNRCTYCLIPRIRGRLRCRSPESLVAEINALSQSGAREITLVAQDLTAYEWDGMDLASLLELLLKETRVPWFRLMYLYPLGITERLLRLIQSNRRICPYLDMPIQHASSTILKAMGRRYNCLELEKAMERIRKYLPGVSVRTTVMVGFPGETEKDFLILKSFIKRWRFHHLGCFVYSDEEEAPSFLMKDKVPAETAERRKSELMALQADISSGINAGFRDCILEVMVDGPCEETELLLCGRSRFQAPEIDGLIYINKGTASPGQIARVRITESHTYDLVGEIVES